MNKMKKMITSFLVLGVLLASAGIAQAATVNITANVQSALTLALSSTEVTFNNVQQGIASAPQSITATTAGSGAYQLTLSSSTFTSSAGTQPVSVLQFKDGSDSSYKTASAANQNIFAAAATATTEGDAKTVDLRVNFPVSAPNGSYGATVTITATPQ